MTERSRIDKHSTLVIPPIPGSPRKGGARGAFSWGGAEEVS